MGWKINLPHWCHIERTYGTPNEMIRDLPLRSHPAYLLKKRSRKKFNPRMHLLSGMVGWGEKIARLAPPEKRRRLVWMAVASP